MADGRYPLDDYELEDRYRRESGRVFLTGTQALVRIPLMQRAMDRAAGLDTAGSLVYRLLGPKPETRTSFPQDLVRRLAEQLYLLQTAHAGWATGAPRDAFLLIEAGTDDPACREEAAAFAERLGKMYQRWAQKRRVRHAVLLESAEGESYRMVMAVSGFGAYVLLKPEAGVHVFEAPKGEQSFHRCKMRVRVAPQPEAAQPTDKKALYDQALAVLADEQEASLTIVRRYREAPSPLVRDRVRSWRTGRLDRVLAGDFDVIR